LTARFSCDIFVTLERDSSRAAIQMAARFEVRRKKQKIK
jgi:hypothetical protein